MMAARDVVVIGASAGGVEPLRRIAADLREGFPAAVFVVLHLPADQPSQLAQVLDRSGPLSALCPEDRAPIEPGRIYVAPPDRHLMLESGRENRHRPSVDVFFRSAARAYGPRVIGVVLSGSGLIAVKIRGALPIVQDPAEAFSADLPRSAMRYLEVDHVVVESLRNLLRQRVNGGEGAGFLPPPPLPL